MKILMSAYSCEPGKGSERGVGWNVVREVAKYHEVWVLTRPDESKEAIEAELARNPVPNLHFVYFNTPFLTNLWRLNQNGAMQIHYYLWQIQAYFVARRLHREIGFDVAQHVTFVKYSNPCFLSLLPIPLVWGPVGGGESAPKAFWRDFSSKAKIYEILRDLTRFIGEIDPFVHLTARKSTVVRATTEETAKRLQKMGVINVQIEPAIGMTQAEIDYLACYDMPPASRVRFVSMGRLLHWKGFHLGLRAFALSNLANAEYWILGDGPERLRLLSLAEELGIARQVKFWGELSREETLAKLGDCHVLVHPSLHDSGGLVCMEAMAASRPVICLDLGGPGAQVTSETGFKIAAMNPEQAVNDLSKAIIALAQDSNLRIKIGKAGQKRVREACSWEAKGENLAQIYEQITTGKVRAKQTIA